MRDGVQILSGQPGVEVMALAGAQERWDAVKDHFWQGIGWALGAAAVGVVAGGLAASLGTFGGRRRRRR